MIESFPLLQEDILESYQKLWKMKHVMEVVESIMVPFLSGPEYPSLQQNWYNKCIEGAMGHKDKIETKT